MIRAGLAAASLLLAAALAGAQDAPDDPVRRVEQLEARLLAARHVAIDADIEATGVLAGTLHGHGEWRERNHASLAYSGELAGRPANLLLAADGRRLELRAGAEQRRGAVGRETNHALLIGLVRMGLLHNLARLGAAQEPDHGSGGIEQWVVLDGFRPTTYAQGGELAGLPSFGFDFLVDGAPLGSARLWLDPATGLPRRRASTVHSAQGDTTIVETYTRFVVE